MLEGEAEREDVAHFPADRPGEPPVVAPAEGEGGAIGSGHVVEPEAGSEPPEEWRREPERLSAGDLLRVRAVHAGPAELRRRLVADVGRVQDDRLGAVLSDDPAPGGEDSLRARGLRIGGARFALEADERGEAEQTDREVGSSNSHSLSLSGP